MFLITVGMSVNLREVLDNWPALLTAVVAVVGVKAVVTFLLLRVAQTGRGIAAETGLLRAARRRRR